MDVTDAEAKRFLERIISRDERAITELHARIGKRIFAFALNRLHDHEEAATVVSDVLLELWKQPHRFNGNCKFMTWVLGIARYKMLHAYRDRVPDHDELDEAQASDFPDGFAVLAEKQQREGLLHLMDELTPDHREALYLMYFEEMSVEQVARIQSCPVGTVKTRLFHARRRMRELIDRGGPARYGWPGAQAA